MDFTRVEFRKVCSLFSNLPDCQLVISSLWGNFLARKIIQYMDIIDGLLG
jgi:hypothetical protein